MQMLSDVVRGIARERPDDPALVFQGRRSSYATLDRHADRVAAALKAASVAPASRIAHLGKNSDRFFELLLGAMRCGVCLVPINWRLSPAEIRFVVDDSGAQMLFADHDSLATARTLLAQADGPLGRLISMDEGEADAGSFADWRDDQDHAAAAVGPVDPEAVFMQLYTSGTTGHPKGVPATNRRYAAHLDRLIGLPDWIRAYPGDVILCSMPNHHLSGSGTVLETLHGGGCVVVMREFSPPGALAAIAEHGVTRAFVVPAALRLLLDDPSLPGIDTGSLRYIAYGASPIQPDVLARSIERFGCGFVQMYGMTECMASITALPPADHVLTGGPRMMSVGLPIPGMEVRIVDTDDAEVAAGRTGEIQLKADFNMAGYWRRPEASAASFTHDGWMRTGDAGYRDEDGYLYLRDRIRDMIISGGENVYPVEVENAITAHPLVAEAAVIGIPDEQWGEAVTAMVVRTPGASLDEAGVIAWARERIARFKCPRSVHFIDALPRNASGKVLRRELREPFWRDAG